MYFFNVRCEGEERKKGGRMCVWGWGRTTTPQFRVTPHLLFSSICCPFFLLPCGPAWRLTTGWTIGFGSYWNNNYAFYLRFSLLFLFLLVISGEKTFFLLLKNDSALQSNKIFFSNFCREKIFNPLSPFKIHPRIKNVFVLGWICIFRLKFRWRLCLCFSWLHKWK